MKMVHMLHTHWQTVEMLLPALSRTTALMMHLLTVTHNYQQQLSTCFKHSALLRLTANTSET